MTQAHVDEEAVRDGAVVVLLIGAAVADASPVQRRALEIEVLSIMQNPNLMAADAMEMAVLETSRIMGGDWAPQGEWEEWILAILGGEGAVVAVDTVDPIAVPERRNRADGGTMGLTH